MLTSSSINLIISCRELTKPEPSTHQNLSKNQLHTDGQQQLPKHHQLTTSTSTTSTTVASSITTIDWQTSPLSLNLKQIISPSLNSNNSSSINNNNH
jgi:hypothetical protein